MKGLSKNDHTILFLISKAMPQGETPYHIHISTGKSKQSVNQLLVKLQAKGLVAKIRHGLDVRYFITPEGIGAFSQKPREVADPTPKSFTPKPKATATSPVSVRAHAYGLAYKLKNPIFKPVNVLRLAFNAYELELIHNTQAFAQVGAGFTARLTTRKLELYTKDIYTDNQTLSIETVSTMKKILDERALALEAKLGRMTAKPGHLSGFSLVRIRGALYSEVVKQHWAYEHHALSEAGEQSNRVLAYHPKDGRQRLIVDMSKGFRELEPVHRITGDVDKDMIDREFNGVLEGRINLLDLEPGGRLDRIEYALEKYANNELVHLELVKVIKEDQKKIREMLRQRRLCS
jgi:DNA-binding MarR family transcriptional regulator